MTFSRTRSETFGKAAEGLSLTEKEKKKLNIDLIIKIIDRMEALSAECEDCRQLLPVIEQLTIELSLVTSDKDRRKSFKKGARKLEEHLVNKHKIVRKGHYPGVFMAIGVALGVSFMTALDSPAFLAVGIAIGVALGGGAEKKAEKEGRIL